MRKEYVINNESLMKEWDWEKNNSLGLFPDKITYGSIKKVWWKCKKCGYGWETTPNHRTSSKTGCPYCSHKVLVKGKNDLQTLYPELAKKWNYDLNKIKPSEVFPNSNKKAWWICEKNKNHVFESNIGSVVRGESHCPICANQKIIIGENDLATTNPELLKEWDYNKNTISPQQVTYGVSKKVWWKCERGHEWQATISSRAGYQKTSCPYCKNELKVSIPEKALAYYLSQYFEVEESKHFDWLNKMEIDLYVPELRLGVEYDGRKWHKDTNRDLKKDFLCLQNNITLIRVREEGCPDYLSNVYFVKVKKNRDIIEQLKETIKKTFDLINNIFNKNLNITPNIEEDYTNILTKTLSLQKEKSVANSDLMKEWNFEKNGELNPALLSLGMQKKVWWKCKEGHEWQAMIGSRNSGVGCPYCAGQKVLAGYNDLQTLYPDIAKEWNYEKNGDIRPTQIRPKTNKIYWWKCLKCGNEWKTAPSHRIEGKNCPKCGRQITIASHYRKVINLDTGIIYDSIIQASKDTSVSQNSIGCCCRGITKNGGGYHWKYIDSKE